MQPRGATLCWDQELSCPGEGSGEPWGHGCVRFYFPTLSLLRFSPALLGKAKCTSGPFPPAEHCGGRLRGVLLCWRPARLFYGFMTQQ